MNGLTKEQQISRLQALRRAGVMTEEALAARIRELESGPSSSASARPKTTATGPEIGPNEAIAPYRFVGLNQQVAAPESDDAVPLDTPIAGYFCGTLKLTFEAETPLLIGADDKDGVAMPLSLGRSEQGPWWIPGASLRGMVRAAAEIVGYGKLSPTNADYVFPLRDFEHPDYNDSNNQWGGRKLGKWTEVKAGWLVKTGQEDPEGNAQYAIHEADLYYLAISDLLTLVPQVRQSQTWVDMQLREKYQSLGMYKGKCADFSQTHVFRDGFVGKQDQPMLRPDPRGSVKGVVVVSDRAPPARDEKSAKKLEYVFSAFDANREQHVLRADSFRKFELVHTKTGRGDERKAQGSWDVLQPVLDKGELKAIPVFYTGNIDGQDGQGEDFAFGLTRLFKVPHRVSQGAMLARTPAHLQATDDMVERLFGYVREGDDETALKGRVAFSGATVRRDAAEVCGNPDGSPLVTVMGTPNASFAPFYLEGVVRDWSADKKFDAEDTRIAGRKRYLPRGDGNGDMNAALDLVRKRFQEQVNAVTGPARNKDDSKSKMRFLVGRDGKPFTFTASIKLHNVSQAEIGLLLMAACFGGGERPIKTFRHMLGRGKPFGAGQLRVAAYELNVRENFGGTTTETACLAALNRHMQQQGISNYPDTAVVREYLGACDPANGKTLPGAKGNEPIYLGLKEHAKLRKRTGKLDKDPKPASRTKSLLRVKKWEGDI